MRAPIDEKAMYIQLEEENIYAAISKAMVVNLSSWLTY
jgi:hypothetical protein